MTLIKDVRGKDCPEVRVLFYGLLKKRSSRGDFFFSWATRFSLISLTKFLCAIRTLIIIIVTTGTLRFYRRGAECNSFSRREQDAL